jgi:hypothetical protein
MFNPRRMTMTKKMLKTIYVRWDKPGNDEPYMLAGEDFDGMVDVGGKTVIGTYQLVETTTAEMVVKKVAPKRSR